MILTSRKSVDIRRRYKSAFTKPGRKLFPGRGKVFPSPAWIFEKIGHFEESGIKIRSKPGWKMSDLHFGFGDRHDIAADFNPIPAIPAVDQNV